MKILFISHSSVFSTYREKLRLLSQRKDLELILVVPRSWPEAGRRIQTQSQPKTTEGFEMVSLPLIFEGRIKRHFYPSLGTLIARTKPDIIHIEEEPYSLVAWQAARAARKINARLVFFTWENLLENFGFPHQLIRSYVLKTADHAIAGDLEAGQLLQKAGLPRSNISIIPQYGVNPSLFQKRNAAKFKKELKLGPFTAGYVGRLVPEKGIQTLMEAFAQLGTKKANLLMVGNGPLKETLENRAAQLGIAGQIRWIPAMDQTRIPDYLNCMDALVLPSLTTPAWKEQFGRVLIEAQACEVTVVGSDSGAIPEVIGKAGLIFAEGNVSHLRNQLKKLASSPALRKSLGRKGRQQVLKLYTNQKIADQIMAIYKRVLAKK